MVPISLPLQDTDDEFTTSSNIKTVIWHNLWSLAINILLDEYQFFQCYLASAECAWYSIEGLKKDWANRRLRFECFEPMVSVATDINNFLLYEYLISFLLFHDNYDSFRRLGYTEHSLFIACTTVMCGGIKLYQMSLLKQHCTSAFRKWKYQERRRLQI